MSDAPKVATTTTGADSTTKKFIRVPLYEAPLAASIKSLKRVSFTTAILSLGIPPAVVIMGSGVPLSGQVAITAVTMLASLGSTSAIHFLFTPYVLSMSHVVEAPREVDDAGQQADGLGQDRGEGQEAKLPEMTGESVLEAKTLSLWGGEKASQFTVDDARPKTRCDDPSQ